MQWLCMYYDLVLQQTILVTALATPIASNLDGNDEVCLTNHSQENEVVKMLITVVYV